MQVLNTTFPLKVRTVTSDPSVMKRSQRAACGSSVAASSILHISSSSQSGAKPAGPSNASGESEHDAADVEDMTARLEHDAADVEDMTARGGAMLKYLCHALEKKMCCSFGKSGKAVAVRKVV